MMHVLGNSEEVIAIIAVSGGIGAWILYTFIDAVRTTRQAKYREESRREIAAYVAEGSMSAEDAAKLLEAGRTKPAKPTES
jgi:hypothetical protein